MLYVLRGKRGFAMPDEVVFSVQDGVADVMLNRPHRRNALTGPVLEGLHAAMDAAAAREDIRVVLLHGAGGALCAGVDLTEFGADPPPEWLPRFRPLWIELQVKFYRCPVPIVGALERFAINGGGPIASCCDLLIAGETAYLQVGEIRQNTSPAMNLAWLLLRHGEAVAARMALTGDKVTGPELLRLGIATAVVPDDDVLDRARELAASIASYETSGVRGVKATMRGLRSLSDPEAYFRQGFSWHAGQPGKGTSRV